MGKKIFVSYKYSDNQVLPLLGLYSTRVRNYVNLLQDLLDKEDHINKGEADGENLSDFKDKSIASKLRDKIFDSTITLVVISKGMKEMLKPEDNQWIPYEVAYSLKEMTRDGRTSSTNALLGIVLPDESGQYDYFMINDPVCNCILFKTNFFFRILKHNMFNNKADEVSLCNGNRIYKGQSSFLMCVKWEDFKHNANTYLEQSVQIQKNRAAYDICKTV